MNDRCGRSRSSGLRSSYARVRRCDGRCSWRRLRDYARRESRSCGRLIRRIDGSLFVLLSRPIALFIRREFFSEI